MYTMWYRHTWKAKSNIWIQAVEIKYYIFVYMRNNTKKPFQYGVCVIFFPSLLLWNDFFYPFFIYFQRMDRLMCGNQQTILFVVFPISAHFFSLSPLLLCPLWNLSTSFFFSHCHFFLLWCGYIHIFHISDV